MTAEPDFRSAVPPLITELTGRSRSILLLTHHNPDGDALGSATALARTLSAAGRRVDLTLTGSWPDYLSFLLKDISLIEMPADFEAYDLVMLLDCHSFDRLGSGAPETPGGRPPLAVIDHHPLTEDEQAGPYWLHRVSASSTGELTWQLIKTLRLSVPPEAVEALMLAMVTDTGFFSQGNTTAETLRATADLMDLGGSLEELDRKIKKNLPLRRLKLMGLALDSLKLHCQSRLAVMLVTPEILEKAGAVMADTEDLVEMGRNLAGVSLSALIKKPASGEIRVSLRSREPVDASALAASFGGGGHRLAAAYNDAGAVTAEEALASLLARAADFL